MTKVGVAWRTDLTILRFAFLVYQEGESWVGRSILTSHVSEGPTPDDAVRNLTRAIDAALNAAAQLGVGAQQWFEGQVPDEVRFVRMFLDIVADGNPEHTSAEVANGACVLRASIAKRAA